MKRPYRLNCLPAIYSVSDFRRFYTRRVQGNCNEFCYCSLAPFAKAHLRCFPLLRSSFCSWSGAPFVAFCKQIFIQAWDLPTGTFEWTVVSLYAIAVFFSILPCIQNISMLYLSKQNETQRRKRDDHAVCHVLFSTVLFIRKFVFFFSLSDYFRQRTWISFF